MRISAITMLVLLMITADVHAGAVICIAKEDLPSGSDTDVEYFLRWGSEVTGYQASVAAREDHDEEYSGMPSCRNTGNMINGYFVVIKNVMRNYAGEMKTTFAFGYGTSYQSALRDAEEEMGRRNWSWKSSDGYSVDYSKEF